MKKAYTLAEVLTSLAVIGVITAVVLPSLNSNVDTKVLERQKSTSLFKLNDGLHRMQIKSELTKEYESTEDFVGAMDKYFNFTTVCSNKELTKCFGKKLWIGKTSYDLSNVRTSDQINMQFTTPANVNGIVFSDGTRALIAYDKGCYIQNIYDTTIDVTKCFAMYLDINGTNGHTTLDEDVIGLNTGSTSPDEWDIGEVFVPTAFSEGQCRDAKAQGVPINDCRPGGSDYWAGAVYKCWKQGKRLPTREELKQIATAVYDYPIMLSGKTTGLTVKNERLWGKLGSPNAGAGFWSSEEQSATNSYYRYFTSTYSNGNTYVRNPSNSKAFCLGDE